MLRNYLKLTFRILWKNKLYSFINISGLAIGMATCFFIYQYITYEKSYDRFHQHIDELYRVPITYTNPAGKVSTKAVSHPAIGPAMKKEFPEILDFTRIAPSSVLQRNSTFSYTDGNGSVKRFNESAYYLADASFLSMFSFPLIEGSAKTALEKPNSIVLSNETANKYFGKEDPLGKTMDLNGRAMTVTGVLKDIPQNSHIKFDLLLSLSTMGEQFGYSEWGWPEFYNYVLLAPGTDPAKINARLPAFAAKYLAAKQQTVKLLSQFHLQPVSSIHLQSDYGAEMETNGSERTTYFLSLLAVLILVIGWINYVNLSTAKSMERGKEVGMRKVSGASRMELIGQFLLDAAVINLLALMLTIIIVILAGPWFDQFIGKNISRYFLDSGIWKQTGFWLSLLGTFLAGAFLVGAFPAFVLASFKPIKVLKGKFHQSGRGILLRKSLVTFQFILSIILIAGSIIMYRQLSFMQNTSPGYNKEQILVVKSPAITDSSLPAKVDYFRTELQKNPAIAHVAPSSEIPGKRIFAQNGIRKLDQDKPSFFPFLLEIDADYIPTYQMKLAAGRNLPEEETENLYESKTARVLVNEEVVAALGYASNEAAIGQSVLLNSWAGDIRGEILGVVSNYHQRSLKEKYDPIVYFHNNRSRWGYFSIAMQAKDIAANISKIKNLYNSTFPNNAFESFFLDEYFDRQYKNDQRLGNIFGLFTALAILLACLGLIGLSTYAIVLRTKEIGIRKVLGSSSSGIVFLFTKDFVRLVFLAAFIAIPVIYIGAKEWLSNFVFHIELGWQVFLLAPVALLVIALLTISLQSVKAALANPVSSLRND